MTARFTVTFDTVTPESAEDGDVAASGFAHPGGWRYDVTDPGPHTLSLREALRTCGFSLSSRGGVSSFEDAGRWFSTTDGEADYTTGAETRYSLHPPKGITPASYRRLRRVLTGK